MIKKGFKQIVSHKEMKKAERWLDNFKKSAGYIQLDLFGDNRIYWRPVITLGLYFMQEIYFDFSGKLSDDRFPYAIFDRHRTDITFGQFWDYMYGITGFCTVELEELFYHLESNYGHLYKPIIYKDKDKVKQKSTDDRRQGESKGFRDHSAHRPPPGEPDIKTNIRTYNIGIS
jgi:hypothetical protein